jgi:hypothetical protein
MFRILQLKPKTKNKGYIIMEEIRILAPTGCIGAGFKEESFQRGIELKPHVIACDAGSTDSGPSHLGAGTPKSSREAVKRDLRYLLAGRDQLGVPLIIGSCGTSGCDSGVEWTFEIVKEIALENGYHFKTALIKSEQDKDYLKKQLREGHIKPLHPAPEISESVLDRSRVVGMMGVEPIEQALSEGAQVILAGRASDTALYAAVPHMRGANPGLIWHMAKTIECGAACTIKPGADSLFVYLHEDYFDVETLDINNGITPQSIAAHTLYENANPFRIIEPSGVLDTTNATYTAISDRVVRVSGARFEPAETYSIKLEGSELIGYQTIALGGIRDKVIIDQLPALIPFAQQYFREKIKDIFGGKVDPDDIDIRYRVYGQNAVMGNLEPLINETGHEVGVLIMVTAPSQEIAHKVMTFVAWASAHLPIPQYQGLISSLAYPFSPPEIDRGAIYRFTLNHIVLPDSPFEMFRTQYLEI